MADEAPVTIRNLIDTDIGPLRRVTGILDSMPTEPQTFGQGEGAKHSTRITVNMKELEVIETTEPYHFPIFTFQMTLSNRKKSRWGVFGGSAIAIIDTQYIEEQLDQANPNFLKPSDRMDIKDCIGKRLGMVVADGEDGRPEPPMLYDGRAEMDKPTPTWTVYEIEGIGSAGGQGVSAKDLAMALLDGKTLTEFNKDALANSIIRNDTGLLQSISMPATAAGSFANALVKANLFTKDEQGVYHKSQ